MTSGRKAIIGALLASLALSAMPAPAAAQAADDARLRKIESELRALQRSVFPGGEGKFFSPEVLTPNGQAAPTPQVGTPSTTAMADMLTRMDTLQTQIAQLTARAEEQDNALNLLKQEMVALKGGAPATGTATPPATSVQPNAVQPSATAAPATTAPAIAGTPTPAVVAPRPVVKAPVAATPAATASRLAKVQAVLKPATDDPADDEYSYGYRLWEAKLYPEAQQQLSLFLQKNPKHARVSYARNLLGRAYLDDGKPREAATYFFQNYQSDKKGDRAPDSLLYLAETMIALKDTNRACIALAEFGESYPALATGRLKDQYDRNHAKVSCN
ncbi:MAG: hypothetical protein RLZZ08_1475 [Pseudomonadota bacterium]|jgi:TolA-binding protein